MEVKGWRCGLYFEGVGGHVQTCWEAELEHIVVVVVVVLVVM